jgi:ubiquinone/menaquinone biosynthesis C-methylase UbiE
MAHESSALTRKEYFNEAARNWDKKYYTPQLMARLEKLVPEFGLKLGQKILDAGTGTGVLIPFLLRIIGPSGSITAIDYAENMIKVFRSKFSGISNVTVELKNIEELDYFSESFDAAICFGLFPHLERKERALSHLSRVLKQGGRLVISHALSSAEIRAHHKDSSPVAKDTLPEDKEMRRLLEQAGFMEIQITDEPGYYLCTAIKGYQVH